MGAGDVVGEPLHELAVERVAEVQQLRVGAVVVVVVHRARVVGVGQLGVLFLVGVVAIVYQLSFGQNIIQSGDRVCFGTEDRLGRFQKSQCRLGMVQNHQPAQVAGRQFGGARSEMVAVYQHHRVPQRQFSRSKQFPGQHRRRRSLGRQRRRQQ